MTLSEYLRSEGITAAEFGRRAGLASRQLVHKYVAGERFPTPENLRRIREATGGKATPQRVHCRACSSLISLQAGHSRLPQGTDRAELAAGSAGNGANEPMGLARCSV